MSRYLYNNVSWCGVSNTLTVKTIGKKQILLGRNRYISNRCRKVRDKTSFITPWCAEDSLHMFLSSQTIGLDNYTPLHHGIVIIAVTLGTINTNNSSLLT